MVYNLFALRSTDPQALLSPGVQRNTGDSFYYLKTIPSDAKIVCGWGGTGKIGALADTQLQTLRRMLPQGMRLFCFGKTKDGRPKHPLYLAGGTQLVEFN